MDNKVAVWDRNALPGKPRMHQIVTKMRDGMVIETKSYWLRCEGDGSAVPNIPNADRLEDGAVFMPLEHGIRFLIDEAFVVRQMGGAEEIRLLPAPTIAPAAEIRLGDDQVIARYDELSQTALYQRVKMIAGSEDVKAGAKKEELIRFLQDARARRLGPSNEDVGLNKAEARDTMDGKPSERTLERIMPKSPLIDAVNASAPPKEATVNL